MSWDTLHDRRNQTNQMNKTEVQVVEFLDKVWRQEKRDERVYLVCGFDLLSGIKETRPTRKTK